MPREAAEEGSPEGEGGAPPAREHALPAADSVREILRTMTLIRRFEERAGEMYAKAKVGGFLHLAIGEEAAIVGAVGALRETDYLLSTYREHGQALARGTPPGTVMAELFGRVDGCSGGRGGSMHLFDMERRFLGGYGIVGGNLPIAAGVALASDYSGTEDVTLCMMGDGATNQGTFGETMNLAALWDLPVVFMVVNNQFGMGTALARHSAETDLSKKAAGFGVPGERCDGMDVLDVRAAVSRAVEQTREQRQPALVEAVTYRFRGHSMADPEQYRSKEDVKEWTKRDPVLNFAALAIEGGVLDADGARRMYDEVVQEVEEAIEFADASPTPDLDSLYDDVYVLGEGPGWWTVDERSPDPHRGEKERDAPPVARELAKAGAAKAGDGGSAGRHKRGEGGAPDGEGEPAGEDRDEQGGGD